MILSIANDKTKCELAVAKSVLILTLDLVRDGLLPLVVILPLSATPTFSWVYRPLHTGTHPTELLSASDEISGSQRLVFDQKEVPSQANCAQEFQGLRMPPGTLPVLTHGKECIWEVWE